jgi:hypothetical protein
MAARQARSHCQAFKAKTALSAARGEKALSELADPPFPVDRQKNQPQTINDRLSVRRLPAPLRTQIPQVWEYTSLPWGNRRSLREYDRQTSGMSGEE